MNEIEKLILKAVFKGFFHATIMPVIVAILVNFMFEGNFGPFAGLIYLIIPGLMYKNLQDRDISKMVFKYTLIGIFGAVGFVALIVLMGGLIYIS